MNVRITKNIVDGFAKHGFILHDAHVTHWNDTVNIARRILPAELSNSMPTLILLGYCAARSTKPGLRVTRLWFYVPHKDEFSLSPGTPSSVIAPIFEGEKELAYELFKAVI